MKKVTSLLISCSLAVAGAIYAQQPDEQASPTKGNKHPAGKGQQTTSETQPGAAAKANPNPKPGRRAEGTGAQQAQSQEQGPASQGRNGKRNRNNATGAEANPSANVSGQTGNESTLPPNANPQARGKKGRNNPAAEGNAAGANSANESTATASATPTVKQQAREGRTGKNAGNQKNGTAKASPIASPVASATPAASAAVTTGAAVNTQQNTNVQTNVNAQANVNARGAGRKADPQKVQQVKQQVSQIKEQHVNFRAQARPDKVPPVTFQANYRLSGAERWQGPQYEVFRSYHPERHDRNWYHSRYSRVELIGGGYYYWNNGYWYPAWGYSPSEEYYAYDAPIYVGHRAEPPDRVIADVQSELQEMGYYEGEVDGLLGPMTRQALSDYQADQGLATTEVIDEPTLDSLGMNS